MWFRSSKDSTNRVQGSRLADMVWECTEHQLQKRYLQHIAARVFDEEAPNDYTEEELREEAAFRCWLVEAEAAGPDWNALPSSFALRALADWYDYEFGEFTWWTYPMWNTCALCYPCGKPVCAQCECYMRHCALSEGWTATWENTWCNT